MTTTVRARVRNGRLVLDEPTDLPKAARSSSSRRNQRTRTGVSTDDEVAQLQESMAQAARGETVPAEVVLRELRTR